MARMPHLAAEIHRCSVFSQGVLKPAFHALGEEGGGDARGDGEGGLDELGFPGAGEQGESVGLPAAAQIREEAAVGFRRNRVSSEGQPVHV
jgi:hypothetical protein